MVFHGKAAIGLFYFGFSRTAFQPQHFVVVALCHAPLVNKACTKRRTLCERAPVAPSGRRCYFLSSSLTSSNSHRPHPSPAGCRRRCFAALRRTARAARGRIGVDLLRQRRRRFGQGLDPFLDRRFVVALQRASSAFAADSTSDFSTSVDLVARILDGFAAE